MISRPQIKKLRSRNQASGSTQLRVTRMFFLSLSRIFDDHLSSNFHRFVILCICWDTPSEKTGLWQLPIVSNVFKENPRTHDTFKQGVDLHAGRLKRLTVDSEKDCLITQTLTRRCNCLRLASVRQLPNCFLTVRLIAL